MSEQRTEQNTEVSENSPTPGSDKASSEIRILLIGGRWSWDCNEVRIESGKSSSGNIILGRDAFVVGRRTARSVQATGEVHGRQVTVVDTPGWHWHCPVENTPKFDRLEIKRSLTLCPPGPHAFLLVIPVDCKFRKDCKMALKEQLEFLSKKVWKHIIVLFTSVAPYDDKSLNNHLRKYPDLQWLLKKCEDKYYVLDINNRDDSSQVITLLEYIEEMAAPNNGQYYKIRKSVCFEDEREKVTKKRAKNRILSVSRKGSELQAHMRDEKHHLTDIQIVMIGGSHSCKSSAANIILGEEAFEVSHLRTTVSCAVHQAEVHGKQLTVVDTPGWNYNHPLEKTPEIDKLEIRFSVYLCHTGPHVILLTIPIDTAYDKSVHTAVKEHMSLLGENVWSHTFVLFTRGDWLGDTTIEEDIEEEGEHLEWLMKQCGNRYHVINCKNPTDSTQVTELLEKIEEMVMENNSCYYVPEIKNNPSVELQLKLKTAKTNKMTVNKHKDILQVLLKEKKISLSEMRIVLLGAEGAGKSMTGNIILQGYLFEPTLLKDFKLKTRTSQCEMKQRNVEGIQVSVVDTPGWSTSTLENAKEILRSVSVCSPGPHAFLLVLPAHESFTKKSQQSVEELMKLFGEKVWRHTVILFCGHWLKNRPIEEYIACEGKALQELIIKCGNRYHVLVYDWNNRSQVRNLLEMVEVMVSRNRGEHFILEKNERKTKTVLLNHSESNMLTEKEWNKREDELIEMMLKAVVVDQDAEESKDPSARQRGSIGFPIPSMGGESVSDPSLFGVEVQNHNDRIRWWLQHPRYHTASSGYDTMSIASTSKETNTESLKEDIPTQTPS